MMLAFHLLAPRPARLIILAMMVGSACADLNRGLQLTVPSHRRELQTYATVSTVAGLTSALANTAVGRIVLASGTYYLSSELSITRSVILEAAVAGSVVLDAQANSSSRRPVMTINGGYASVVQLIGLRITGGYASVVRAHVQKFLSPRWDFHMFCSCACRAAVSLSTGAQ